MKSQSEFNAETQKAFDEMEERAIILLERIERQERRDRGIEFGVIVCGCFCIGYVFGALTGGWLL